MRKILTVFAALFVAVGLIVPAYAANTEYTYTETSEYVYLKEGATLYVSPDAASSVYGTVSAALAESRVYITKICNETGMMCFDHNGCYVWIDPENASTNKPVETELGGEAAETDVDSAVVEVEETPTLEPGEEGQVYVWLAMGAEYRLGPGEKYNVYKVAPNNYNTKILICGVCDNGWIKYQYFSGLFSSSYIYLYIAPENVIWNETNAYTSSDYYADCKSESGDYVWEKITMFLCGGMVVVGLMDYFMDLEGKIKCENS